MSIQTIKQTSDTQSNLYFEYIYNLRKFQNSLLKISTIEQIELLSSEVMAYFDCHYQLKVFFKEQLNNFLKTDEVAGDFDSIYRAEYKKIKEITQKIAEKNNITLEYNRERLVSCIYNKKNIIKELSDIPIIYLFPSISLSKLTKHLKPKNFLISDSVFNMYQTFDCRYNEIKIPLNIEFYIVISLAYMNFSRKYSNTCVSKNMCCYHATALNYVLTKMQEIIKNKITNEYFDEQGIIINDKIKNEVARKHILTYRKDEKFYIDGKLFNLTPALKYELKNSFIDGQNFKKRNTKTYMSRINKIAQEQIGQYIIKYSNGKYSLEEGIFIKDYTD